jgi:hypothetical protein
LGDCADLRLIPTNRGGSTIEEVAVGINPRPGTYILAPRSEEPLRTEGENRTTPLPNDPRRRFPAPSSEDTAESSVMTDVLLVVRDGGGRRGDTTGLASAGDSMLRRLVSACSKQNVRLLASLYGPQGLDEKSMILPVSACCPKNSYRRAFEHKTIKGCQARYTLLFTEFSGVYTGGECTYGGVKANADRSAGDCC